VSARLIVLVLVLRPRDRILRPLVEYEYDDEDEDEDDAQACRKERFVFRFRPVKTRTCLLLIVGLACAASGEEPKAAAQPRIGPMPWHLTDVWWTFPSSPALESISVDVDVRGDIPVEARLYCSPIGGAQLGGEQFYGGIQTKSDGKSPETGGQLTVIGPGAIFSRWGERSLDAVRRSLGGYQESSGHEGDFISVRQKFPWTVGRYTYSIRKLEVERTGGSTNAWFGAFVRSHQSGDEVYVGALRFPGAEPKLREQLASFVEIYGPAIAVDRIPRVTVRYGNWVINGEKAEPREVVAEFARDVPQCAVVSLEEGLLVIRVGDPVDRAKEPGIRSNRKAFFKVLKQPVSPG
jgi:hypothetical protein